MKAKMVVKVKLKLHLTLPNAASGLATLDVRCRQPKTFIKQQPVLHFDVGFFRCASRNSPLLLNSVMASANSHHGSLLFLRLWLLYAKGIKWRKSLNR